MLALPTPAAVAAALAGMGLRLRAITCGNGLDPNVQMKRGLPIMLIRALSVIVVGYICLQIPAFSQVGSL